MNTLFPYLELLLGFALLIGSAEALVRSSVAIAERFNVPKIIIAATIVSFGTSVPELFVSIKAVIAGQQGVALGNILGSNIANVLLIVGVAALIYPISCAGGKGTKQNIFALILSTALFSYFLWTGQLVSWMGALLLLALAVYWGSMFWGVIFKKEVPESPCVVHEVEELEGWKDFSLVLLLSILVASIVFLVSGASLLVDGAVKIATMLDVPEAIIGLTVVAFGTSLPELAATSVAAYRRHSEVAVGNVLGSNILNILLIGGTVGLLGPGDVDPSLSMHNLWVMFLSTFIFTAWLLWKKTISRSLGALFLLSYFVFIFLVCF